MESEITHILNVITTLLPQAGIPCIMIGGHAVNHYGVTRATQDIDFMIPITNAQSVRQIMHDAGFTNISEHETVLFVNQPDSLIRVDFLKVDPKTMQKLIANAVKISYLGSTDILVPQLHDLLAMKLFALATGGPKRKGKDFGDIANLVIENNVDVETDLCSLSRQFATDAIFKELHQHIEELRHA